MKLRRNQGITQNSSIGWLAAADQAEAEADRRDLLEAKGADANASETKVELIRKKYGTDPDAN